MKEQSGANKYDMMLDELMEQYPELKQEASDLKDALAEAEPAEEPDMPMEMDMEEDMPLDMEAEDEEGMEFPAEDEEEGMY